MRLFFRPLEYTVLERGIVEMRMAWGGLVTVTE